jgi:hypothetical protein
MQNKGFGDYICQLLVVLTFWIAAGLNGCQLDAQIKRESLFVQVPDDVCGIIVNNCDYLSQFTLFSTSKKGAPWIREWRIERGLRKKALDDYFTQKCFDTLHHDGCFSWDDLKLNFQATCMLFIKSKVEGKSIGYESILGVTFVEGKSVERMIVQCSPTSKISHSMLCFDKFGNPACLAQQKLDQAIERSIQNNNYWGNLIARGWTGFGGSLE